MLGHFCELAALTSAGREVVCLGTSVNWSFILSKEGSGMFEHFCELELYPQQGGKWYV